MMRGGSGPEASARRDWSGALVTGKARGASCRTPPGFSGIGGRAVAAFHGTDGLLGEALSIVHTSNIDENMESRSISVAALAGSTRWNVPPSFVAAADVRSEVAPQDVAPTGGPEGAMGFVLEDSHGMVSTAPFALVHAPDRAAAHGWKTADPAAQ